MSERARLPAPRSRTPQPPPIRYTVPALNAPTGNLQALGALGIRAKLSVSQPSDPDEVEADRAADAFARGQAAPTGMASTPAATGGSHVQRQCADCDDNVMRKAAAPAPTSMSAPAGLPGAGGGAPLPRSTRAPYERFFGTDLSSVRVHNDSNAHAAAASLNANAFSRGPDIYFARGQYTPETSSGKHLLAHELTHTLQRPAPMKARRDPAPAPSLPPDAEAFGAARAIATAMNAGDVDGVVSRLHPRSVLELKAMRISVFTATGQLLENWLMDQKGGSKGDLIVQGLAVALAPVLVPVVTVKHLMTQDADAKRGGTAEEGLRWLWPALPLVPRLKIYDEGYREIEKAQLDVIRNMPTLEVAEAWNDATTKAQLVKILADMDAREEYQARLIFDGSTKGLLEIADRMLSREEEEPLFDAILTLPPTERAEFVRNNEARLYHLLSGRELELVRAMARPQRIDGKSFGGNEVDALVARLLLATENRRDDQEGVKTAVDRAVALLGERKQLQVARNAPNVTAEELDRLDRRLQELAGLDRLFATADNRFLTLLSDARDNQGQLFEDTQRMVGFAPSSEHQKQFTIMVARKRIVTAGADLDEIRSIIESTVAPPVESIANEKDGERAGRQQKANEEIRKIILSYEDVAEVLSGLKPNEQKIVYNAIKADDYTAISLEAARAGGAAQWGQLFATVVRIAHNERWRRRYHEASDGSKLINAATWQAQLPEKVRQIVDAIVDDPAQLPVKSMLAFSGDPDLLKMALAGMPEDQRTRLRRGWALARGLRKADAKEAAATKDDEAALAEYRALEGQVRSSSGDDAADFETILAAVLGSVPSLDEMATGEGRYAAALMMFERIKAGEKLDKGVSASFTEADETMDAAARQFLAMWMPIAERGSKDISHTDLAMLTSFYDLYRERHQEFADASNAVSEMAGMIAATVAGILVVVATGGAATLGVIALAAASGAGARVITREMFGADYYRAMSDKGARDALLGSIDGALAVVSGRLAAKGAELVGMGGKTLVSEAARVAGSAAAEASETLSRRVASGAVEAAIDGMFSGTISEGFGALTDENTWRMGIMNGLVRVGHAAVLGGLMGAVGGGIIGGAMPIIGSGVKRLAQGLAGKSLEKTLERAGQKEGLAAARKAASAGDWAKVNELTAKLEEHLAAEEANALQKELRDTLQEKLGRPPGLADNLSAKEEAVLNATHGDGPNLTPDQIQVEHEIVARSKPQPSTERGYIDEVDLGNGHSWKRDLDGNWCRFSAPTLCAKIKKAPKLNATEKKLAEKAEEALDDAIERTAAASSEAEQFLGVYKRLAANPLPDGKLNLAILSDEDKYLIESAQTAYRVHPDPVKNAALPGRSVMKRPLEELTLNDVAALAHGHDGVSFLHLEIPGLVAEEARALERFMQSQRPAYEKLRKGSPSPAIRQKLRTRARGLDEVSGRPPLSGATQADHIYPLRRMYDELDGFKELSLAEQLSIANYEGNFKAVDASINASRQDKSWRDAFSGRGTYSQAELDAVMKLEHDMKIELQKQVDQLGRKGPKK